MQDLVIRFLFFVVVALVGWFTIRRELNAIRRSGAAHLGEAPSLPHGRLTTRRALGASR